MNNKLTNYLIQLIIVLNKLIHNMILNISKLSGNSIKYCYIMPFILNKIGKDIPIDAEPAIQLSFNMFILTLIILICFINIIGYFISIYLINKYDVENKYPKYARYIRYFEKSRLYLVVIEIIICLVFLIIMLLLNAAILGFFIFK